MISAKKAPSLVQGPDLLGYYDEICPIEWHDSAMRSLLPGAAILG